MTPNDLLTYFHVEGHPLLYAVGPLEARVTIHDQQIRATNLVYALEATGTVRRGDSVAIIGGGVAGLTAAAAARKLDLKPTVFESRATVCAIQAHSDRWIYPRLYDWPHGDWQGSHQVPFLQWQAGPSCDVVIAIRAEFSSYNVPTHTSAEVIDVACDGEARSVHLSVRSEGDCVENFRDYSAAIVAVGYGVESTTPAYWDADDLGEEAKNHWLIGGLGDGALIDALRLRLDARDGDFYRLLHDIAAETPKEVCEQLIALETRSQALLRAASERRTTLPLPGQFSEYLNDAGGGAAATNKTSVPNAEQIDVALQAFHEGQVQLAQGSLMRQSALLNDGISRILINAETLNSTYKLVADVLRRDTIVTLIGPRPSPFTLQASVLNRWVIALVNRIDRSDTGGGFRFLPGKLEAGGLRRTPEGNIDRIEHSRILQRFGPRRPIARNATADFLRRLYEHLAPAHVPILANMEGPRLPAWGDTFSEPSAAKTASQNVGDIPSHATANFRYFLAIKDGPAAYISTLAQRDGPQGLGLYLAAVPTPLASPNSGIVQESGIGLALQQAISRETVEIDDLVVFEISLSADFNETVGQTDEAFALPSCVLEMRLLHFDIGRYRDA